MRARADNVGFGAARHVTQIWKTESFRHARNLMHFSFNLAKRIVEHVAQLNARYQCVQQIDLLRQPFKEALPDQTQGLSVTMTDDVTDDAPLSAAAEYALGRPACASPRCRPHKASFHQAKTRCRLV